MITVKPVKVLLYSETLTYSLLSRNYTFRLMIPKAIGFGGCPERAVEKVLGRCE